MLVAAEPSSWSIVGAAGHFAAFAALGSGFAFGGLTYVLTRSEPERSDARSSDLARHAVGEFILAAVITGVAAFEWAIVAGESDHELVRTEALAAPAGFMLALGTFQLVTGVCYLVIDFNQRQPLGELGGSLISLCLLCFRVLAALAGFYVAWATLNALWVGFSGWPRPSGPWNLTAFGLMVVVLVALGSRRPEATVHAVSSLSLRPDPKRVTRLNRPLSEWHAVVFAAALGAIVFLGMFAFATDGSVLARAGTWNWDLGVMLYVAGLIAAGVATVVVVILQGWLVQKHARLESLALPAGHPSGRPHSPAP